MKKNLKTKWILNRQTQWREHAESAKNAAAANRSREGVASTPSPPLHEEAGVRRRRSGQRGPEHLDAFAKRSAPEEHTVDPFPKTHTLVALSEAGSRPGGRHTCTSASKESSRRRTEVARKVPSRAVKALLSTRRTRRLGRFEMNSAGSVARWFSDRWRNSRSERSEEIPAGNAVSWLLDRYSPRI